VILSVQHDAHNHLVALISTPPSGGFSIKQVLHFCNLWPWQLPFNLTGLFTKLLFIFLPDILAPDCNFHCMVGIVSDSLDSLDLIVLVY
jgi:hypothetical protein